MCGAHTGPAPAGVAQPGWGQRPAGTQSRLLHSCVGMTHCISGFGRANACTTAMPKHSFCIHVVSPSECPKVLRERGAIAISKPHFLQTIGGLCDIHCILLCQSFKEVHPHVKSTVNPTPMHFGGVWPMIQHVGHSWADRRRGGPGHTGTEQCCVLHHRACRWRVPVVCPCPR